MPYADEGGGIAWTKGAIAAAVVVATIVLLAAYALWPDNGDGDSTATGSTTTVVPPGPTVGDGEAEPPPDPAGECPSDRQNSTEIPPPIDGTVTWDIYNGAVVPRSSTAGPLRIEENGVAHCYEQSPSGAVLMAINFNARSLVSPDPAPLVEAQMFANSEKAQTVKELSETPGPILDPSNFCQFVAYRVRSFTGKAADIELVTECGANDLRVIPAELRWVTDDWQIVLETPADRSKPPERVASLDGFTPFRGVG